MLSPWDDCEQQVQLLKDGGDHVVTGIDVFMPPDGDDDRISVGFRTATGMLRVRLPRDQVIGLAQALLRLTERRISEGDGDDDFSARQVCRP
jgi:hypothetical protein